MLGVIGTGSSHRRVRGEDIQLSTARTCHDSPIYRAVQIGEKQLRSIEISNYKYITPLDSGSAELYDTRKAPHEKDNLVSKQLAIAEQLRSDLLQHEQKVMKRDGFGEHMIHNMFSNREKERLKSLGYLQ